MRIQKKTEKKIINYYKDKKKVRILEYEIGLLERTIFDIDRCRTDENTKEIETRLEKSKRKLIEKKLQLNEIINENMGLEAIIVNLDREDKELFDLRYNRELGYQEIGRVLHISNSTISRRLNSILTTVNA
ncbi:hypothetical protein NSA50_17090 [Clostridium sp. DSM 100503]|uniref:sigma factor-like helix-turn-helix DNA-binding protein n=1 Tax=Clostridium sp. DSM 100503 TaxID=2963282 RepID=UPI002149CD86|nr:sigma factor-like helix-turn-helix DNA-binding protein [Clostridium sp. DSM 100503]MCR1952741.1 hypothetical protein [Clostridium sp. DSM 100503]